MKMKGQTKKSRRNIKEKKKRLDFIFENRGHEILIGKDESGKDILVANYSERDFFNNFFNDYFDKMETLSNDENIKFNKELRKINRLLVSPFVEYNVITETLDENEFDFPYEKYYALSVYRDDTGEKKIYNSRFENHDSEFADHVFYWYVLQSTKIFQPLRAKVGKGGSFKPNTAQTNEAGSESSPNPTYSQSVIALSVYYMQAVGSISIWAEGTKTKALGAIAQKYGVSSEKLRKSYNKFALKGCETNRLKSITNEKTVTALKTILKEDSKALSELTREIMKNTNIS